MPLPRFIQLSTLTTYSASLLNRDDTGQAKRIPYGGAVRTRISSQCLKRHWRTATGPWSLSTIEGLEPTVRSRTVFGREIERPLIEGEGLDKEAVLNVSAKFQSELFEGSKKKTAGKGSKKAKNGKLLVEGKNRDNDAVQVGLFGESEKEDGKGSRKTKEDQTEEPDYTERSELTVLGRPEIEYIKKRIREIVKGHGDKDIDKEVEKYKKELVDIPCGAGLSAALFGRFMSGDPAARVTAAVHVAHAFTVHEEESETDYFTAVDDLAETPGAGHINVTELDSGVYYGYVVIDVPQLVSNITGCELAAWKTADRTLPAQVVEHLLHLITTVTPGAKLGSTAPYARPWLVLASAGDEQPYSLAEAFYNPVPLNGGIRETSAERLAAYIAASDRMYGTADRRLIATMLHENPISTADRVTIDEMGQKLRVAVETLEL